MRRHQVPRALRRKLRRLGKCWRPVVLTSGLKEWSDKEVARLRSGWVKGFLHRHVCRSAFLVLLYLVAFGFLAASFERYWHWVTTVEAMAGEPVKMVDKLKAYCAVYPLTRGCKPASGGIVGPAASAAVHSSPSVAAAAIEAEPNPTDEEGQDPLHAQSVLRLDQG